MPQWMDNALTMVAQTYFRLTHPIRLAGAPLRDRSRSKA